MTFILPIIHLNFIAWLHIYYIISKGSLKKNIVTISVPLKLDQEITEQVKPPNIHLKKILDHPPEIIIHDT